MKKNLFKRIMGLALAAAMTLTAIPPVSAEETLSGIPGTTPDSWGIEMGAPLINTDHAHSGNASLYVKGGERIQLIQWGDTSSATFDMGMWVYNPNGANVTVSAYFDYYDDGAYTLTKQDGDWYYYERSNFWLNWGNVPVRVYVIADKDVLIDDVTFYRNENQLFANTSFEDYSMPVTDAPTVAAPSVIENAKLFNWHDEAGATLYVTNEYSHSGNNALYLKGDARIFQFADLSQTDDYTIGFWVRFVGGTNVTFEPLLDWTGYGTAVPKKRDGDWYYYEKTWYNVSHKSDPIKINITAPTGVILDDVTLTRGSDGAHFYGNTSFENYIIPTELTKLVNNAEIAGWNKESGTATISLDDAHTGKASLYAIGASTIMFQKVIMMSGDYTVDWWAKYATGTDLTCYARIDWGDLAWPSVVERDDNGWVHYRTTLHYGTDYTEQPVRLTIIAPEGILLDDITLASSDGKQLYTNSSFEDYSVPKMNVLNLTAYPAAAGGSVVLSWNNPNFEINALTVKQDGTELSDLTIDKAAKARNEFVISGLENDREYTFTVTTTVSGEEYQKTVTVTPIAKASSNYAGKNKIGSWTSARSDVSVDGTMKYANITTDLDKEEKASGNASFKFSGNLASETAGVYANVSQTLTLQKNKKYKLFVKAKSNGSNSFDIKEQSDDVNVSTTLATESAVSDWSNEYIVELDSSEGVFDDLAEDSDTYEATISVNVTKLVGSLWIDDVALYSLDYDGMIDSDNLLSEGGFEFAPYEVSAKCGTLTDGEFVETGALRAGSNTIKAEVKNENASADFSATVAVALYKNGTLVNVTDIISKKVSENAWYEPTEEYTFTVNVPAEDSSAYSAKVFFWNDISGMTPLDSAVEF